MKQFTDRPAFRKWNDEMARKYDSESFHLRSGSLIRWIERKRVRAILDFLDATADDLVVEVGCGAGVVLEQIPAAYLLGLDLSAFILQNKTKQRLSHRRAGLVQANGERLPLPARRFDKILCTEVIEHVLSPRELVHELARIARAEGTVVLTIPNDTLIDRLKKVIGRLGLWRWLLSGTREGESYDPPEQENEWHLHDFDLPLLEKVLAGVLEIERLQAIPFSFLPLRYVTLCRVTNSEN